MITASINALHEFFEQYADCLARGDARGISQLFATPCLMTSDDRSTAFTDAHAVEVLFLQGFSFLRKHRIASARPDVRSRKVITPQIIQVVVEWSYFDSEASLLYKCDYLYGLHHSPKGWRIETAISINEKERMQAAFGIVNP